MSKAKAAEVAELREQVAALRREMASVRGAAARAGDTRRSSGDDDRLRHQWERAASRAVARRRRSAKARVQRAGVIFAVYLVGSSFVSIDPGGWFHPKGCGGAETSAAVSVEPAVVRVARDQGKLLRRLGGPPPEPAETVAFAERAGDAFVASTMAFRASLLGRREPAQVAAYSSAHAHTEAENVAACDPCPGAGTGAPGRLSVAYRPAGADPAAAAVAQSAAVAAGFTGPKLDIALRVAWLESGFSAGARNPHSSAAGVWQIMRSAHADDPDIADWRDPYASARMAWRISRGGTDWSPWSVWPRVRADLAAGPTVVTAAAAAPVASCAPGARASTYRTGAGVAWGGHSNGQIPARELVAPASAPGALLRSDAAAAFDRLSAAYAVRFGRPLRVTDSYRDLAGQRSVYARKPGLAARPGTSNHGWALAVDAVVGGYGSVDYQWLRAHAPAFGWDNPEWARPGGSSKHEPWHWEFNPTGASA